MRTLTYLCGPSCAGKSSVADGVERSLSVHRICGDDYWNMYPSLPFGERVERTNQHVLAAVRGSDAPDVLCEWVPCGKVFADDLFAIAEAAGRRFLQVVVTAPIDVLKRRKLERDGDDELGPVAEVSSEEHSLYKRLVFDTSQVAIPAIVYAVADWIRLQRTSFGSAQGVKIDNVRGIDELDRVLRLVYAAFPHLLSDGSRYTPDFWAEILSDTPELLLYAADGEVICGSVFACADGSGVTIAHCCVDEVYRGKGIGSALMLEAERRIKALGYYSIALGALEGAEEFYEKLGYTGSLLIQSEKYSIDELKAFNQEHEVLWTNVYDGAINQLCLRVRSVDRELQRRYEQAFPGCSTQMVFGKRF